MFSRVENQSYLPLTIITLGISYVKEGVEMDHLIEATKATTAHFFFQELPDGYQTPAGIHLTFILK